MTNTDGIEYTTVHDYKPTHPPVSKAVLVAKKHADKMQAEYDAYVEEMLNDGKPGIDWTELERYAEIANDADRALLVARDKALNCKHENTSMTGTMTFAGEVDDDIVTVCEDCGRKVSG